MITTLDLVTNLDILSLTDWNDVSRVYDLSGRYGMVTDFINRMNPQGSTSLDTTTYRKLSLGQDERVAQVASVTNVGVASVTVALQPQGAPTPQPVQFYRVSDHVLTSVNGVQGKIIGIPSAGVIEIEPIGLGSTGGTTVANLAAALTVNSFVSSMGGIYTDKWTSGVDPLNYVPEVFLNYLSVKRDGHRWAATDGIKTRPKYVGKNWSESGIALACQRMLKDIERSTINGIQARYNSAIGGPQDCNGGIDWSIQNRGGSVVYLTAAPTRAQFEAWLIGIVDRRVGGQLKTVMMGRSMFAHITNNFGNGYVMNYNVSDQNNNEKDINTNIRRMSFGGIEVNLMTNIPVLQDPEFDPTVSTLGGLRRSWYCYCIDTEAVPVVGGGVRPSIEKIHFGDSPFYAVFQPGIREFAVNASSGAALTQAAGATTQINGNAIDGNAFDMLYHGGIDMVARYSGMMFPIV